jgi:hypothetical protein
MSDQKLTKEERSKAAKLAVGAMRWRTMGFPVPPFRPDDEALVQRMLAEVRREDQLRFRSIEGGVGMSGSGGGKPPFDDSDEWKMRRIENRSVTNRRVMRPINLHSSEWKGHWAPRDRDGQLPDGYVPPKDSSSLVVIAIIGTVALLVWLWLA